MTNRVCISVVLLHLMPTDRWSLNFSGQFSTLFTLILRQVTHIPDSHVHVPFMFRDFEHFGFFRTEAAHSLFKKQQHSLMTQDNFYSKHEHSSRFCFQTTGLQWRSSSACSRTSLVFWWETAEANHQRSTGARGIQLKIPRWSTT